MQKRVIVWSIGGVGLLCALVLFFGFFFVKTLSATLLEYFQYGYVLPENVERRFAVIDDEKVSFLVFSIQDNVEWDFANDPSLPRSVHEWRTDLGADVVINGSYFSETYQPTGYYVMNGNANTVCPLFSSDYDTAFGYTFVVWIENSRLDFGYLPDHPEICGGPETSVTAFASFPTLVYQNESMIEKNSGLKAHRTFLAQTVDGEKEIFVTESGEVTLFDAAEWFLRQDEDYAVVGNLDGGPSTGMSLSGDRWNVEVPSAVVPNVVWGRWE